MTVGDALQAGRERLRPASESPAADASRLLEAILARDAAWLLAHASDPLPAGAGERYTVVLARRAAGEPLAYLTGSAGFYGRRFAVTPAVLVPRPESEHLVELALARLASFERPVFCDVGTGSGVLAITLACERPDAFGFATDVSVEALAVARSNAAAHGVASRLEFRSGDLLEPLAGTGPFACIVANLPYVPSGDLAPAPDSTSFEPRRALDGGPDGLALYRRLLAHAPSLLQPGGSLLLEAAPATASALAALAASAFGPAASVSTERDYGGRERVVAVATPPAANASRSSA